MSPCILLLISRARTLSQGIRDGRDNAGKDVETCYQGHASGWREISVYGNGFVVPSYWNTVMYNQE